MTKWAESVFLCEAKERTAVPRRWSTVESELLDPTCNSWAVNEMKTVREKGVI